MDIFRYEGDDWAIASMSYATNDWFLFCANERSVYEHISDLIDRRYNYREVMDAMAKIITGHQRHVRSITPNRIMLYVHLAINQDRFGDVCDSIKQILKDRKDLYLAPDEELEDQPQHEDKPMAFELKTVTFLDDHDVEKIDKDQLFSKIKKAKERITTLEALEIDSDAVHNEIESLHEFISDLVDIIDRRFA